MVSNYYKTINFRIYCDHTMHYLIEFRFSGYAKKSIRELRMNISKQFGTSKRKLVPHITMAGPLYTRDEARLIKEVVDICKKYDQIKFKLDGFSHFEDRVIYVKIKPSPELVNLRADIAKQLNKFCETTTHDVDDKEYTFHATLVMKDIAEKFDKIWNYVQTWKIPELEQHVPRITIIKNQRILAEYDLVLKKLLTRNQALDRDIFKKTMEKIKDVQMPIDREFIDMTNQKIYLISDTHFDHDNIIKYCNRPFGSAKEMNQSLVKNWNSTVDDFDKIFFLGDMAFGRNKKPIDYWLSKLSGDVLYIRGNHDKDIISNATVLNSHYGIKYDDHQFLLMHDPERPPGYDGWIIHGDKHNNNLGEYPFVNQGNKTVNVCAELVDYTPLSLERLMRFIETGQNFNTING